MPTFNSLKSEYRRLYDTMVQTKFQGVTPAIIDEIRLGRPAYEKVTEVTGVPWWFIGIIHSLECSCDFKKHLHNGDPLTARTTRVPKGRPKTGKPPFSWHDSAVDALQMKGYHKITDWSPEKALYLLEKYNGWGYRKDSVNINSPYLWSGTNHYTKGKFVKDHVFSKTAVSKQIGAAILMKDLAEEVVEEKVEKVEEKAEHMSLDDVAVALLKGLDGLLQVFETIAERNKKKGA